MDIKIEYENFVTPFLERVLQDKPRWMASALKSTGDWAQREIKAGIKSGAPGGQKYPDLSPLFLRKKLKWGERTNRFPLGRLRQAIGYEGERANEGVVLVGWLSRAAVRLGTMQEKGFTTEVTGKMRRKFNAVGLKLSKKRIVAPARPTFKPMRPIIETGAPAHFQKKLAEYLTGAIERSKASSRRKYKVYK